MVTLPYARMPDSPQLFLVTSAVVLLFLTDLVFGHGSHRHSSPDRWQEKPTGFHDPKVIHDADHIKEHYEGQINVDKMNEKDMSPEELEFHYFKLHDYDNNTKLDGLELYKALSHMLPYESKHDADDEEATGKDSKEDKSTEEKPAHSRDDEENYYIDIIDSVLEEDDLDKDGYLTYYEYILASRREDAKQRKEDKEK